MIVGRDSAARRAGTEKALARAARAGAMVAADGAGAEAPPPWICLLAVVIRGETLHARSHTGNPLEHASDIHWTLPVNIVYRI